MTECLGCQTVTPAKLKCPKCVEFNKGNSYFCSQECFSRNYKAHASSMHRSKQEPAMTSGHESLVAFREDDMRTWTRDARLRPFALLSCKFSGALRPWPTTPMKALPEGPPEYYPDYAKSSESRLEERSRQQPIHIYSEAELAAMRESCAIGRQALDLAHSLCQVGVTGVEIDDAVHEFIVSKGAYPSPLNYYKFPKSCCISVNEVVCHGIPDFRPLRDGDIVNVDISVFYKGMHSDLNETYGVGDIDAQSRALIKTTHDALMKAIDHCKPDVPYRDIGKIIESHCQENGFSVVRNYTGHGVGKLFHTLPTILHYSMNKAKGLMRPGHVFTIEPMVNAGKHQNDIWPDNWTAVTLDGKRSAQFEHQVLVTQTGCEVLTARTDASPPLDF